MEIYIFKARVYNELQEKPKDYFSIFTDRLYKKHRLMLLIAMILIKLRNNYQMSPI